MTFFFCRGYLEGRMGKETKGVETKGVSPRIMELLLHKNILLFSRTEPRGDSPSCKEIDSLPKGAMRKDLWVQNGTLS